MKLVNFSAIIFFSCLSFNWKDKLHSPTTHLSTRIFKIYHMQMVMTVVLSHSIWAYLDFNMLVIPVFM